MDEMFIDQFSRIFEFPKDPRALREMIQREYSHEKIRRALKKDVSASEIKQLLIHPEDLCKQSTETDLYRYNSEDTSISLEEYEPTETDRDEYTFIYWAARIYQSALPPKNDLKDEADFISEISAIPVKHKMLSFKKWFVKMLKIINNKSIGKTCDESYLEDQFPCIFSIKLNTIAIRTLALVLEIRDPSLDKNGLFSESTKLISLKWAEYFYKNNQNNEGATISAYALTVNNPRLRSKAYNLLGLMLIENGMLQLAYDTYLTWIEKEYLLDQTLDYFGLKKTPDIINAQLGSNEEKHFRISKNYQDAQVIAHIYGNMSYLCGVFFDLCESTDMYNRKMLNTIGNKFIAKAEKLDPDCPDYYCTAGSLFSDTKDFSSALKQYKDYFVKSSLLPDKVISLLSIVSTYMDMLHDREQLSQNEYEEMESYINSFIEQYRVIDKKTTLSISEQSAIEEGREYYSFLSHLQTLPSNLYVARDELLKIKIITRKILQKLMRQEYTRCSYDFHYHYYSELTIEDGGHYSDDIGSQHKEVKITPIAYYTYPTRLKHLFKEHDTDDDVSGVSFDKTNGQNRFTMMHTLYMNDPEEGIVLLERLRDYLPKNPIEIRDVLLDQKYVFLKSFTSMVDSLNMWTQYGSNKEHGGDCNGCCVCIAPQTFEFVLNSNNSQTRRHTNLNDDYHLYNVAYLAGEKVYLNGVENQDLQVLYDQLKYHLSELMKYITNIKSDEVLKTIVDVLVRCFEKIMFLFKDSAYGGEKESRLILSREIGDDRDVKQTDSFPPRLYINPPMQVFIEKIILGPKIDTPDYWIPFLQKQLHKIALKWPSLECDCIKPTVRKSEIKIRD